MSICLPMLPKRWAWVGAHFAEIYGAWIHGSRRIASFSQLTLPNPPFLPSPSSALPLSFLCLLFFPASLFLFLMATPKGSTTVANAIKDIELGKVQGPADSNIVKAGSFWESQTVVVHMLRRFGCKLCRANALELKKIAPILEANDVRIVAVGIEKLGLEEFQKGGYWDGELYLDNGKKIHKALELKSVGFLNTFKMIYDVRNALKASNVPGNLKGDGRQLGATFVIAKGGTMLLDFRQKDFADHPSARLILDACGVDPNSYDSDLLKEGEKVTCDNK